MYAKIIRRQAKPGSLKKISDLSKKSGVPDIESAPGFVAYYVVDLGGDEWATVAVFDDKSHSERWTEKTAAALKESPIHEHIRREPHTIHAAAGPVLFAKTARK
jgi:hypothetical protein